MADEEKKDPAPTDESAFLVKARKRFDLAVEATSQNRAYQLDDVRFAAGSPDNGWQWPEKIRNSRMNDPNGPRPVLTNNVLPQHIRQVTNEQRQNRPEGRVLPVDDNGDVEVAEVLNGMVRHIQVRSHADMAYDTACEHQVTSGEGYWRLLTEYCDEMSMDQDILIEQIRNPFSVYMDPDGLRRDPTGRKCAWAFITDYLPTDSYKAQFPNAKSRADWDNLGLGDEVKYRWFDDQGVTIAEYFSFLEMNQTLCAWSDGSVTIKQAEYVPPEGVTQAMDQEGKPIERKTVIRTVRWAKINGAEVLESETWVGKYIPVIRVAGNEWEVEGRWVVSGIVRNAKDPQRMLNYWTSQEAEMLALAPKAPYIGYAEVFEGYEEDWADSGVKNFPFLRGNRVAGSDGRDLPLPERSQPPMIPAGFVNAKLGAADDVKAVTGQYDPSLGKNPQSKSGVALQREQVKSEVGTYHYIDNLSRAIGYSTEQIIDMIPKIYDTKRVARIIGEDGEPDHCTLDPDLPCAVEETRGEDGAIQKIYNPGVGQYDVVVVVGPSFTTKRQEAADFLTQAAQGAKDPITAQVVTYLALNSQDWAGAREAAKMVYKLLPPQIKDDEDGKHDPEKAKEQLQQAAQALGQREAELNAHAQQLEEAEAEVAQREEQAKAAEAKAKDALGRVQAEVDKLNTVQADFKNQQEVFKLQQQIAEQRITIQSTTLASDKEVAEAAMKVLVERMNSKLGELNATHEATQAETKSQETLQQIVEQLREDISRVEELAGAERELITDEAGEPVGSRPKMKEAA